jgi:hypothetical protein
MKAAKLLIIGLLIATAGFAFQQLFDEIAGSIRSGSARDVAKYMNSNVDLTILNQEEVYSKAQAEVVLRDFFSKNTPKSFTIIHQGASKEGAKYAIGNLITDQGTNFRVYIFLKQTSGNLLIHELRFEKS